MIGRQIRGTQTDEREDAEFLRFFRIVQDAAEKLDSVFFLWSPECHDGQVGDVWCEDLSGWLVPSDEADAFESIWETHDQRIWSNEFNDWQSFARWSPDGDSGIRIEFEFPMHGIDNWP